MKKIHKETELILLGHEEKVLNDLKKAFIRNLVDVKQKVRDLTYEIEVMQKADPTSTLVRSKIYQLNYQKSLEKQLANAMKMLADDNISTVEAFLMKMYEDGYITQQYVINSFDIPVITPINMQKMIKAINTKVDGFKFSKRLYDDIMQLGAATVEAITDGIAKGKSYAKIAEDISLHSEASMKRAWTIARTEGGRVSSLAKVQSQMDAKALGADIVKRWDATLDNKTRPQHRELDGQVREIEDPFDYYGDKAQAPRLFNIAAMDINCRCVSLTLPRWDAYGARYKRDGLITEQDLKAAWHKALENGTLQQALANPYGLANELRKVENYADWKKKYYEGIKK